MRVSPPDDPREFAVGSPAAEHPAIDFGNGRGIFGLEYRGVAVADNLVGPLIEKPSHRRVDMGVAEFGILHEHEVVHRIENRREPLFAVAQFPFRIFLLGRLGQDATKTDDVAVVAPHREFQAGKMALSAGDRQGPLGFVDPARREQQRIFAGRPFTEIRLQEVFAALADDLACGDALDFTERLVDDFVATVRVLQEDAHR